MESLLHWVSVYGYAGIFTLLLLGIVGLPVPDETLLTLTGYLIYRGELHLLPAFGAALGGSLCGITISYALGHTAGLYLVEKYGPRFHFTAERLEQVHAWFRRIGRWTLTVGYFIPGVRHFTAYVAGASKLEAPMFALYAYAGALLWCTTFIGLGYFLGERWDSVSGQAHRIALVGCAVAAVAGGMIFWWRRRRDRRRFPI